MARSQLTRSIEFPAGHRYYRSEWSEQENAVRFGKCANEPAHGHDYRIEVTVEAEIDERTGMAIDLSALDALLAQEILRPMDHAFLNDLPEFAGERATPTTENLARVICDRLAPGLPAACSLRRVRVREGRDLWSDYRG